MEPPGGRDSRFNLGYNMNLLSGETSPEIYGNPNLGRPSTSLQQLSPRHTMVSSACNRALKSDIYDERGLSGQGMGLDSCVNEINEDSYSLQSKKSPPSNGKKTKGRVKIKMEYIENKLRRYTTFSKRKTGIMKKAYELSTLTGTQVMLLVASETGHVYTFATRKLQPMITSEAGKALIQTCLNSPDPPAGSAGGDQRMSATGFEETELTYNISDDDSKEDDSGSASSSEEMETTVDDTIDYQDAQQPSAEDPLAVPLTKTTSQNLNNIATKPTSSDTNKLEQKTTPNEQNQTFRSTNPLIIPSINIANNAQNITSNTNTIASLDTTIANSAVGAITTPAQLGTSIAPSQLGTVSSAQLGAGTSPSQLGTSITPAQLGATLTTVSNNGLQALPLVLHTPTGSGYASTPDGMILGLLQGPNMAQPQIVAIPMSSVASISGVNVRTVGKDDEGKS